MLITPPSLRLDYALPACCQARLLGCDHRELRAGAEQTRQRRNHTINRQAVTLRPWPGCEDDRHVTESGNLCYMHLNISCKCNWVRFSSFFLPTFSHLLAILAYFHHSEQHPDLCFIQLLHLQKWSRLQTASPPAPQSLLLFHSLYSSHSIPDQTRGPTALKMKGTNQVDCV